VKADIQAYTERTIEDLMKAIESISSEASKPLTLIVIPSDVYNALSEERRKELEGYKLDVSQDLTNTELLAELIREYTRTKSNPNGCALSDRELSELAGELAKFDSGHALIARLIGEELARNNCSAREIKELISKAKGKAEKFIILHINGLFKIHKKPKTAKALVEVFALRRPFVDSARPGAPILTPGIIELIGEKKGASLLQSAEGKELRNWLALRQHDLIEEAIKKLLKCIIEGEECKELGDAPEPWKTPGVMETLIKVSEKVRDESTAVEYFVGNYGEKLTNTLKVFSNVCWKRAALIIGHALTGHPIVPRPEDLPESLNRCGVDYYLLVDNVIPPLIRYLTYRRYTRVLTEAFIDRYNKAVAEVNRILNIARGRGRFYDAERFYGLGLASIIADAARLGRDVKPGDADVALHIATFAIRHVASPDLIKSVLGALEPLRDKAPHRYLELLAPIPEIENLDSGTVKYILNYELNEVLGSYGDVVKEHAWSLVHAIIAYANLLWVHRFYFDNDEVKGAVGRVADLVNELGKFKTSLSVIAWAHALAPALENECVRRLMEEKLRINVVDKATSEVLKKLNDMRERVQELMRDEEFMSYVESRFVKADEETVKEEILEASSDLKHALARYRLDNNELNEAEELYNQAAEERKEIGDYENELGERSWVLRIEAIKGSLVGEKLVNGFRRLYEETFKEEHFKPTAPYLSIASDILGNYLVSLALTGDQKTINKLLEEHLWVLNADRRISVLTRLMLNALLSPRGGLSGELERKLRVNPEELIDAFEYVMFREYLPALRVALKTKSPEEGYEKCKSIEDTTKRRDCEDAVSAVMNDSDAAERLRGKLIDYHKQILQILEKERSGWLRELGLDADALISEFEKLVYGLDGKSLAQLIAPSNSIARLTLMLNALISGNKKLAKALALYGAYRAVSAAGKLPARLFLKVYKKCCDLNKDEFRHAIAKLFFYHI